MLFKQTRLLLFWKKKPQEFRFKCKAGKNMPMLTKRWWKNNQTNNILTQHHTNLSITREIMWISTA